MTAFTIDHPWEHPASGVDWTHWWSPSPSMQQWLPWGTDKKAVVPQIKHFYLNHAFRQACADLGIVINDSHLGTSGSVTFRGKASNGGEIIIDVAESLPIEAIYYMLLVKDKEKLERICEFIDAMKLDDSQQQSNNNKQDLLNIAITMHDLLGAEPGLISAAVMEQAISMNNNFTPEQRQEMLALLKKRQDILQALVGLFKHMYVPMVEQTRADKHEIRIVVDMSDQNALAQAQAMQQNLSKDSKSNVQIVDFAQPDQKIEALLAKSDKTTRQSNLLEDRFAGLINAVGSNEVLRRQLHNEGVNELIVGVNSDSDDFVTSIGVSIGATQKLWSVDGSIPTAMSRNFILPKDIGIQCIVSDPVLVQQYPEICVMPGNNSSFTPPTPSTV